MQQFTVPQFIDVEDKIIGPITTRQFILLLVMGLFGFIAYTIADFTLFVFLGVLDLVFFGTLAFARINGMPFHFFLLNILQTVKRASLRVWFRSPESSELKAFLAAPPSVASKEFMPRPKVSASRLAELSLLVDTGGVYRPEE